MSKSPTAIHSNRISDDSITILIIHQSAELYGSDRSLIDLLAGIDRGRFLPIVCVPEHGPLIGHLISLDVEVHVTPLLKADRRTLTSPWLALKLSIATPRVLRAITRLVGGRRIDLVYTNTIAVLGGAIWAALHRVPHVWHVREIIRTPRIASFMFRWIVPALSSRILCNSHQTRRWISPSSAAAVTIWNGVPPIEGVALRRSSRQTLRSTLQLPLDSVVVLMAGRINGWKGQDLLLDAIDEIDAVDFPDFHLLVIGSGAPGQLQIVGEVARRIDKSRHRTRVSMHPFSEHMGDYYLAADVVVVPSRLPEPFGRVAIEAMAHSLPVIAARHGGLVEIVEHGRTGILFEPNNVSELSGALRLLLNDASLRARLGVAGQARQRDLFSVRTYVRNIEAELLCALRRRSPSGY
jgi:glycosyltransferase involved in cell wall biosynthesis